MKTSDCITECAAQQYVYAATQNDICYCGFTYGKYGISTNCKKICPGDSGDICGNDQPSDKISNSVYEVLCKICILLYVSYIKLLMYFLFFIKKILTCAIKLLTSAFLETKQNFHTYQAVYLNAYPVIKIEKKFNVR